MGGRDFSDLQRLADELAEYERAPARRRRRLIVGWSVVATCFTILAMPLVYFVAELLGRLL